MLNPEELTKRYYSIGEVAKMFDESPSLLRYWESIFADLNPKKRSNGIRQYTAKDIMLIQEIHLLVKGKGYTLEGANEGLKTRRNLRKIKSELENIKSGLMTLKSKL